MKYHKPNYVDIKDILIHKQQNHNFKRDRDTGVGTKRKMCFSFQYEEKEEESIYLSASDLFEMEEARWFGWWSHQHLSLVLMRDVDLKHKKIKTGFGLT